MGVKRERISITMAPSVKDYVNMASDEFGMSISAFITMCVQQYRMNSQAINEIPNIQGYIDQMKGLQGINLPSEIKASVENVAAITKI